MENNISNATTTTLQTSVQNFSVAPKTTDGAELNETRYNNEEFPARYGYYSTIAELKRAIDTFVNYAFGKGYTTDPRTKIILEHVSGTGKETFTEIASNHLIVEKFHGDAYMQIIRDKDSGTLINLKNLDPFSISSVWDKNGRIKYYEVKSKAGGEPKRLKPEEVFHTMNERVGDNTHGTSVIDSCKWVIDAKQESMNDYRRLAHRATIRVMYVDADNTTRLSDLKAQYSEAIKKGELLILPGKKDEVGFEELTVPPIEAFLPYWRYLDDLFFITVGTPRVVTGSTSEYTEASAKVGVTTFDQAWIKAERKFEDEFWKQVYLKIKWYSPASLMDNMQSDESKNISQVSFQPNDTKAGSGKA